MRLKTPLCGSLVPRLFLYEKEPGYEVTYVVCAYTHDFDYTANQFAAALLLQHYTSFSG